MSNLTERAEDVFGQIKEYLTTNFEIIRLKAVYKVSEVLSTMIASVSWIVSGLLFILFLSVAAGFYFGRVMDNLALGFLSVAGFYFILMLIFMLGKKSAKKSLMDGFIRQMLKEEQEWKQ